MLDVGCEIFSSHFIFEAGIRGSATQQQVIHTPMHSITLEIQACAFACQTRAGHGAHRLICCHCIIGSVISFYTSAIIHVQHFECSAIFGTKTGRGHATHAHAHAHKHLLSNGKNWQKAGSVLYASRPDTRCLKDAQPLHLMKLKWRLVTMFLKCIKNWRVKFPLWD